MKNGLYRTRNYLTLMAIILSFIDIFLFTVVDKIRIEASIFFISYHIIGVIILFIFITKMIRISEVAK